MSFDVISLKSFDKQAKRLSKKYPSLKKELSQLIISLSEEPVQGSPIGHGCYKIRFAISSKGRGKSGGARVITNIFVKGKIIFLLSIYDKSEVGTISDADLLTLLSGLSI
ncbi:MAG: hypothetical protein ABI763_16805 [Bacteroidota bacterium]